MFLAFSLITLGGALALFRQRNAVQAGLCMLLSFFGVAGLFLLLANPVAGALQVVVYSGAITVLVLFVVMLLQAHEEEPQERSTPIQRWLSAVLVAVLGAGAVALVARSGVARDLQRAPLAGTPVTLEKVGLALFGEHLIALETAGLLLLAAMIAAVILVKKETQP